MPKAKKIKLKKKKLKVPLPEKEAIKSEEEKKITEEPKKEEKEPKKESEEPKEIEEKEKKESVRLSFKALDKILRHGMRFSNLNIPRKDWVECMGFLIGNVDDNKVEIKDAIPMVHGNLVEVEFADEHYVKADEINQSLTEENWIVGWYHTHPGHGLFLSAVDKINHSGYQSLNSKAVALVFDPSKLNEKSNMNEYMKVFRLKNPELREKSEFIEIEKLEIEHSTFEAIASVYETSMLHSKDHPLVLEYGEVYKKPDKVPEKIKEVENAINEMRDIVRTMHSEIKMIHNELESRLKSTKKTTEDIKVGKDEKEVKTPKEFIVCEFCGYESNVVGDTACANCGKKFSST